MEHHKLQNLYEAAFLHAKGFHLMGKEPSEGKVSLFFAGEGVKEAALEFYNSGTVEAKKLCDSYRTLKDYIFER